MKQKTDEDLLRWAFDLISAVAKPGSGYYGDVVLKLKLQDGKLQGGFRLETNRTYK